jgi:hypothetical protein
VTLRRITYGEIPSGFIEDTVAAAMTPGVTYEFSAHGWTRDWMPSVPWYGGGRAAFLNGSWQLIDD